jgi:hypothetical protein
MDDIQIANLVLVVAATAFVSGVLAGYGIRTAMLRYGYGVTQRRQIEIWSSPATETKEPG